MKPQIYKVIKKTACGFHSWCSSSVGIIRKPNNELFDDHVESVAESKAETNIEIKLGWWRRFWNWILKLISKK